MRADIELIFLPYDDRSQKTLADILVRELKSGGWTSFHAAVAFARQTGNFEEIQGGLRDFCEAGGSVDLTFGANIFADSEGSDYEAIETLLKTLQGYPQARLYLFHDPNRTFHPKVYIFNNVGAALMIIGSSNWSDGGFVSNIEVNPIIRLNFDNKDEAALFEKFMSIFDTYWRETRAHDEGQGWARRVTKENLPEFKHLLRSRTESTRAPRTAEPGAGGKGFGGVHFKTPKRFTPPARQPREQKKGEAAAGPIQPSGPEEEVGFWKVLSDFDVSRRGAPGQIIIPMIFRELFPNQKLVKPPDAGGKGRQWDTEFPVDFRDGDFKASADARFIVYEPESGHPRPNTECRFTFRNRAIFDRLNAGDILSFRFHSGGQSISVERFSPVSEEYRTLRNSGDKWGTVER